MKRRSYALGAFAAIIAASLMLQGSYFLPQLRIIAAASVVASVIAGATMPRRMLVAFGLLATGIAVSWIATGFDSKAEKPALTLVMCGALAALASTASRTRNKEAVLDAIVLITGLVAGAGIIGVAFHWTRFAFLAQSWRASSVLTYQNADAAVCAIGLPVALVRGGKRTAPRVAAVVIATGLAATQSRGGAIAAALGIAVLLLRERPAALPRLAACSALAFAGLLPSISGASWGWISAIPALGIAMAIAGQPRRLTPRTTVQVRLAFAAVAVAAVTVLTIVATPAAHRFATTSNDRTAIWRATLTVIAHHPIVGTGPGSYVIHTRVHDRDVIAKHAHNEYLQTASETGLFGLFLVLLAIATLGVGAIRLRGPASDAAVAAGVTFLVHSSFDFLWRVPSLPAIVLALVATALTFD